MKKIYIFFVLILIFCLNISAQTSDSRVFAMSNAFTAVTGDSNVIFFNPAGLAYLKHPILKGGGLLSVTTLNYYQDMFEYPEIYNMQNAGVEPSIEYYYHDPIFNSLDMYFDPSLYGFPYTEGDESSYTQACLNYIKWYTDNFRIYSTFMSSPYASSDFYLNYADKKWGVGLFSKSESKFIMNDLVYGVDNNLEFIVDQKIGGVGAFSFDLGFLSIGANLKLYLNYIDHLSYNGPEMPNAMWYSSFLTLLEDAIIGTEQKNFDSNCIEIGTGVMLPLGTLMLGAYIDQLLYASISSDKIDFDLRGLYETLNLGISFKLPELKSIFDIFRINFLLSSEIKNIGSDMNRSLAIGSELRLKLFKLIELSTRIGYNSRLPGNIIKSFAEFDPIVYGVITGGAGIKILCFSLNLSGEILVNKYFIDFPGAYVSEDEGKKLGMKLVLDAAIEL